MTQLALVAALLTGLLQDEPGVTYREGLFQEIDEGNLEKALELYGRVLKSNAEQGMKARALFRQGYCLEKSGRKKDAEQVYRDLNEHFADQGEIAKLARARLAALSGTAAPQGASLEGEIQQLILDLGTGETREKAINRLSLIGNAAIPELKRALGHKDVSLAVGAARALLRLEQYEGLYDVFARATWEVDFSDFGKLLQNHPKDRERLIMDSTTLPPRVLYAAVAVYPKFESSRIASTIEERILKEEAHKLDYLCRAWWSTSERSRLPLFVKRLIEEEKDLEHGRLFVLLDTHGGDWTQEPFFQELSRELEHGLKNLSQPTPDWFRVLYFYMTPKSLVYGLLDSWLKSDDLGRQTRVLSFSPNVFKNSSGVGKTFSTTYEDYVFDAIASEGFSDDLKKILFLGWRTRNWQEDAQKDHKVQLLKFYTDYLTKFGLKQGDKDETSEAARTYLIQTLAEESPGWVVVFDQDMRVYGPDGTIWIALDRRIKSSERLRSLYVEAALRAMTAESPSVQLRGAHQFNAYSNSRERLVLAKTLPSLSGDKLIASAVHSFSAGFHPLSPEERVLEIQAVRPLFRSPTLPLRRSLTSEFMFFKDASVAEIMKEALEDADVEVRKSAIAHWAMLRQPESMPFLIQALRDPDDGIKKMAITNLGESPSLDAVPPLIEFLHSSNPELRASAQSTLKAIQQYFDEQEQWRKWYEEMKQKTSPKKEK